MKKISSFIYIFTITILLLWLLPWTYNFLTVKSSNSPFTLYSSIVNDFAMIKIDNEKDLTYCDLSGNKYTEEEFDSILPFFYTRQLVQDERMPDSINGMEITPKMIQFSNFVFSSKPIEINSPKIGLYYLLESMSKRVDLKMPEDVFRSTSNGLEFINTNNNQKEKEKSKMFTEAMLKKGFKFPITEINGNATTRKDYDEGYVILDSEKKLFHLKQVKGKPYVRYIDTPRNITLNHLFITEFKNKKSLAFATDTKNNFYVIENKSYKINKIQIPNFNPEKESIRIIANMIDWTVNIYNDKRNDYYAINADDYSIIKKMENKIENNNFSSLHFTDPKDNFVYPRF